VCVVGALAVASVAHGQLATRGTVTVEATDTEANTASPFVGGDPLNAWSLSSVLVGSGNITWESTRVRLGADGGFALPTSASAMTREFRLREAYARVSALPWLDVEAGKRLLRWGTGYAFTPTGLLDPPRDPTDPQDRYSLNEGIALVRADAFRGATSLSVALAFPQTFRQESATAPATLIATRFRTTVAGLELSGVGALDPNHRALSVGGNFTYVPGQHVEFHGELLSHRDASLWKMVLSPTESHPRDVSGVVGLQYTFERGTNVVAEYFHDGNGLDPVRWNRLFDAVARASIATPGPPIALAGATPLARPDRQDFGFVRVSRANTNADVVPEVIVLACLDDGGFTIIPTLTVAVSTRVQVYARVLALTGPSHSADGSAPLKGSVTIGLKSHF
jgi:hypothetical protein